MKHTKNGECLLYFEKWQYRMDISWKSGVCALSLPWKNGEWSRQIME